MFIKFAFGKFNIFSMNELPIKLLMYCGIGKITSKRFGFAKPSFAFKLDKNKFGENDI